MWILSFDMVTTVAKFTQPFLMTSFEGGAKRANQADSQGNGFSDKSKYVTGLLSKKRLRKGDHQKGAIKKVGLKRAPG